MQTNIHKVGSSSASCAVLSSTVDVKCFYQNARGLRSKVHNFFTSICASGCAYQLIAITETWLRDGFYDAELFPSDFVLYRCDRRAQLAGRTMGGGVLLAVHSSKKSCSIDVSQLVNISPLIDAVACKCAVFDNICIFVIVLYIPPDVSSVILENLFEELTNICCSYDNIIVLGDFNVSGFTDDLKHDPKTVACRSFVNVSGLLQVNTVLNGCGRLLDLVLSDLKCTVTRADSPLVLEDPYHPALEVVIDLHRDLTHEFPINIERRAYNFRRADVLGLYEAISITDWSSLRATTDINDAVGILNGVLRDIFDKHVPMMGVKRRRFPVWYTPEIIAAVKKKQRLFRVFKSTHSELASQDFKRLRSLVKKLIVDAYSVHSRALESGIKSNPKKFWSFVQSKKGTSRIPGEMHMDDNVLTSPQAIVDAFATFFSDVYQARNVSKQEQHISFSGAPFSIVEDDIRIAIRKLPNNLLAGHDLIPSFFIKDCSFWLSEPLKIIFNLALSTSVFPEAWKMARICPVHKSGDVSLIGNYRPIAIIPNFGKVFEIVLQKYLFLEIQPLISPHQHGFLPKRSTVTNLSHVTEYINNALDDRGQVDVIYTDFSRAFDSVDHDILLQKLKECGLGLGLVSFFHSYLSGRMQYVAYNDFKSFTFEATSGVPQGSNIGPLLFIIFINDLLENFNCPVLAYADDLKLFTRVTDIADVMALQCNLSKLFTWCEGNKLHLNITKCKTMTFTRKQNPIVHDYCLGSVTLDRVTAMKDLGVLFDSALTFREHITNICSTAQKMLGFVIRTCRSFESVATVKVLYYSYVRSKLDYAAIVWYPYYEHQKLMLERVQRRYLKYLSFKSTGTYPCNGYNHEQLLKDYSETSLHARRQCSSVKFLFKLMHSNIDEPFLLSKINLHVPRASLRCSRFFECSIPLSNLAFRSPIRHMCCNFNLICNECDINHDSLCEIMSKILYSVSVKNAVSGSWRCERAS